MGSIIKILVPAVIVGIAAFAYVFGRGRSQKGIADIVKKNILSYEDIVDDLKAYIDRNKGKYSNSNLKMQILSSEMVLKMSDFLKNEGIDSGLIGNRSIGFIVLANSNPVYIKIYSYQELAQDLLDVLPENGIYEQSIEI